MRNAPCVILTLALGCSGAANNMMGTAPTPSPGTTMPGSPSTPGTETPPNPEGVTGCKKIDLAFAIDNSSSMNEEKSALANTVFPAFARALRSVGGGLEDYRVGVLDACPTPAAFHTRGTGGECHFTTNQPWMSSADSNLEDEFRCVGAIDSSTSTCSGSNDDEQPISTAIASLQPAALAGANHGFLRHDALLVVVALTDEDEQPVPSQSPEQLYQRMKALKGNDASRMVLLGIGGAKQCDGVYGSAKRATKLTATTDLFVAEGRGVFWDLCTGHLEDGLTRALEVIEQACGEYTDVPIQ